MTRKILVKEEKEGEPTSIIYERSGGTLEIYADFIAGIMGNSNVMKINFATNLMEEKNSKHKYKEIVCTIVMPTEQLQTMSDLFLEMLENIKGKF